MRDGVSGPTRWSGVARFFHWLSALLILSMLGLGLSMTYLINDSATKFDVFQFHKSLGFCVLAVMLARLLWRLFDRAPPPPPDMPRWQHVAASLTHVVLYILAFGMILSGWIDISTTPLVLPTRFFDLFTIPSIAKPNRAISDLAATAHIVLAWTLMGLLALHIAAALKHHLIDKDDVLRRMWPF